VDGQVLQPMPYLEPERVFVARPTASIRVEKKTFFVFLGNVVVQVLRDRKLTVKLNRMSSSGVCFLTIRIEEHYLFKRDAVILQE
jgi:hypothetical protein